MTVPRQRRAGRLALGVIVLALVTALGGAFAVTNDAFGAGHLFDRAVAKVDRFLAGPVPDRSAPVTVVVPQASEDAGERDADEVDPSAEATGSAMPSATPAASLPTPVGAPSVTALP